MQSMISALRRRLKTHVLLLTHMYAHVYLVRLKK
jgi:hypothetical protein